MATLGSSPALPAPVAPAAMPIRWEVAERLRVLAVAGIPLGVLVGGVVGRLAMLLLRLTSPDFVRGLDSDDGFTIGRFTLSGSYNLLLLGAGLGVLGVAVQRAVDPWLLGPAWLRRATCAVGAGAVVGSMLLHADGIDFNLLEPTWLAVGLFVAIPALFGALAGPCVEAVAAPGSWTAVGRRRWVLPLVLVVLFPLVALVLAVAAVVLAVWVPFRREVAERGGLPTGVGLAVRAAWLAIAVLGLVAVVRDVRAIA
jgi:hypothetical protein